MLYEHAQCVYNNFDQCPTKFGDFQFQDILRLLPKKCHVVMNESMVLSARLVGALSESGDDGGGGGGGDDDDTTACPNTFEVLLLSPADYRADPDALLRSSYIGQVWRAMIRSNVVQINDIIILQHEKLNDMQTSMMMMLRVTNIHGAWIEEDENDGIEVDVEFLQHDDSSTSTTSPPPEMEEILCRFGTIPIPPYLNRDAVPDDDVKYQTVYAKKHGSVAAPTAGLHFSNAMMEKLHSSSRSVSKVTLHVGAGTFKPVDGDISNHAMHRESWEISKDVINSLVASLSNHIPIIPVGTTSVRVLESLYWMGARNILKRKTWYQGPPSLTLSQWEPNDIAEEYTKRQQHLPLPARALESLLWEIYPAAEGSLCLSGTTEICIASGHKFQVVVGIITNFHQSKSTLMH
jgi:S-adenosylmethionine:tRNA-ribosyltransferase-isomerase (queuine synthetase)